MATRPDTASILNALNIKELPLEEQEELLLDLGDVVFRGSMLRLMERMDEKTKREFDALLDKDPTDEEMLGFLEQHVPDADGAVEETLAELRSDILAVTG